MSGARRDDDRNDERPADPGVDVAVPDVQVEPEPAAPDEPSVDDDPGEQESG